MSDQSSERFLYHKWKHVPSLLDGYLDVNTILKIRLLNKYYYDYRWKLYPEYCAKKTNYRTLDFSFLRGSDGNNILLQLREILKVLNDSVKLHGIVLNFSHCVLLRDVHINLMFSEPNLLAFSVNNQDSDQAFKLIGLNFDFCSGISDQSMSYICNKKLTYLRFLSCVCIRNENFEGNSFKKNFKFNNWPSINIINLCFSSVDFDTIVFFYDQQTQQGTDSTGSNEVENDNKVPEEFFCEFYGTVASRICFEQLGWQNLLNELDTTLINGDVSNLYKLVGKQLISNASYSSQTFENIIKKSIAKRFSSYLLNIPIKRRCEDSDSIDVWTLPIADVIRTENLNLLKNLVDFGACIDVTDLLCRSILYRAVSSNNVQIVKLLIDSGINLYPIDFTIDLPLNEAIKQQNFQIFNLLLESGYNVNFKAPSVQDFKTPLILATSLNLEREVHLLLDWGADLNYYPGSSKNSPLMLAYISNSYLLNVFLNSGNIKSIKLTSDLLTAAIARDDIETVKRLIIIFPVLAIKTHPVWGLPHVHASRTGKNRLLKYLISVLLTQVFSGTEVICRTKPFCSTHSLKNTNDTFLYEEIKPEFSNHSRNATERADEDEWLETYDRTSKCASKITTINLDLPNELSQSIQPVYKNGVNPDSTNNFYQFFFTKDSVKGNTALHHAVESGHVQTVKLLLRYSFATNLQNLEGDTPVHIACSENRFQILAYLLSCNENVFNIRNRDGYTPLMAAIKHKNNTCCEVLFQFYEFNYDKLSFMTDMIEKSDQPCSLDYAIACQRLDAINALLNLNEFSNFLTTNQVLLEECKKQGMFHQINSCSSGNVAGCSDSFGIPQNVALFKRLLRRRIR